jgi:restriction system protein
MAGERRTAEFTKWIGPLLDTLRELGGSAKPREACTLIARRLELPASVIEATNANGQERFYNQVAWARQYLVWEGLLDGSRRGTWSLTPKGWETQLSDTDSREIYLKWAQVHAEQRRAAREAVLDSAATEPLTPEALDGLPEEEEDETALLDVLRSLSPAGFEGVCAGLLRDSGFEEVTVEGRSGDGGIDGVGVLQLNAFVRMRVLFQCKRYSGTVSRAQVGEFRNAMIGRAEKGIFMTTGRFSRDAVAEAIRDGAPPVELVDGTRLVELFEQAGLGLTARTVYDVDYAFFEPFKNAPSGDGLETDALGDPGS